MEPVLDLSASFGDNNEDFNIYNRVQNLQAYHPKDYNDFSAQNKREWLLINGFKLRQLLELCTVCNKLSVNFLRH